MLLYIHLPFCKQKCRYCDFCSYPGLEAQMPAYVDALLQEAENRRSEVSSPVRTVYIGGGTPSLLPGELLQKLLQGLHKRLPLDAVREFSSEANPGTLSESWLKTAAANGVNRLSLGMQAKQDELLTMLGRIHRYEGVVSSVKLARQAGIKNLNLDLMFGLPGQTRQQWQDTLYAALALQPQHISAYGLIPEEGTPLKKQLDAGALQLPDVEAEREMYEDAKRILSSEGFLQYEVSNFALPGCECRHNIGYWTQEEYLGLGASAASLTHMHREGRGIAYERRTNPTDLAAYLQAAKSGQLPEAEVISGAAARFETLMLCLRMNEGVSESRFESLHGISLNACHGKQLRLMQKRGLMNYACGRWFLTDRGMDIQNQVLVELMDEEQASD